MICSLLKDYQSKWANQFCNEGIDIQTDLDNEISSCKMLGLIHSCVTPKHPTIRQMKPLTRLQFCDSLCKTHTTGQRGADLHGQFYNFYTMHACKYIGPASSAVLNVIMVNKSKVNQVGRVEYISVPLQLC